ncbi:MAG: transketolase [Candidatus Gottesmanbacteria bacterium]
MKKKKLFNLNKLTKVAKEIRKDILDMAFRAQSAHSGGALSCVEILTILYFCIMNVDPKRPDDEKRDRLVFSKAHDAKVLFATLAERGFFPKKLLEGYEQNDGLLGGHSIRHCVPGVEISAGSLGHGLSIAVGLAMAAKLDHKKHKVFAVLSDGECDEGATWEAVLFAGHHKLDNLIVIIDYNKLQAYGRTKDVLDLEPFESKWKSFQWGVKETKGNDLSQLIQKLSKIPFTKNKPSVLIAHTIKGLGGVKKYVNQIASQYKPPTEEEYKQAMKQLL